MNIFVNGEPKVIDASCSMHDLLIEMGLTGQRFAVELNEQIISKSRHPECFFKEGDKLEIVQAIGGG